MPYQLYGHQPPIMKTIKVRRTRHAVHCWRSGDELVSDVLLWTPSFGQAKAGRPARTYIQQLCEDTGCSTEDLLESINNREGWWERVRDIRPGGTTRWWWNIIGQCEIDELVAFLLGIFLFSFPKAVTLNHFVFLLIDTKLLMHILQSFAHSYWDTPTPVSAKTGVCLSLCVCVRPYVYGCVYKTQS